MTKPGMLLAVMATVVLGLAAALLAHVGHGKTASRHRHPGWGAVGDSITYGAGSSDPGTQAYPAQAGIAGRGVPGQCLVAEECVEEPLLDSFPSELGSLQQDDVEAVVVEIGINDLGLVTDRQYVDAFSQVRAEGAARGVRVVLATITPFGPGHPTTAAQEVQRERVNSWIRSHGAYVDFDAALRQGRHRVRLDPRYDCGDGMHPSDAGYARLAAALDRWIAEDE